MFYGAKIIKMWKENHLAVGICNARQNEQNLSLNFKKIYFRMQMTDYD